MTRRPTNSIVGTMASRPRSACECLMLLPDPTPGRAFSPPDPNHLKGYIGEAELANLVHVQGDHFVVALWKSRPGFTDPMCCPLGPTAALWSGIPRRVARNDRSARHGRVWLPSSAGLRAYVAQVIASGRLPPELGYHALREFEDGNYNVCTVGTANAHNGYIETIRKRRSSGRRRP